MDIIGDRRFVEVPGERTHELPPLLVKTSPEVRRLDKLMQTASEIVDQEEILVDSSADQRRVDLAVNLVDRYLGLVSHWHWGDAVIEWIRQCEITFGTRLELRNLLRSDVWPHAGRSSFVQLLADKSVEPKGVSLGNAVGLRLAFRQMPPIRCCSDQFLIYLNNSVAQSAYQTWFSMTPGPVSSLPPERFAFDVVNMSLEVN